MCHCGKPHQGAIEKKAARFTIEFLSVDHVPEPPGTTVYLQWYHPKTGRVYKSSNVAIGSDGKAVFPATSTMLIKDVLLIKEQAYFAPYDVRVELKKGKCCTIAAVGYFTMSWNCVLPYVTNNDFNYKQKTDCV